MIELDEKDIRAVGRNRWIRKHDGQMLTVFAVVLACFIGLMYLMRGEEGFVRYVSFIPIWGLLGYMIWYMRNLGLAEKRFIEEWRQTNAVDRMISMRHQD